MGARQERNCSVQKDQVRKRSEERDADGRRPMKAFILGFCVTALSVLCGYIAIGVWPFGDGTVLIIDSIHQYLPFYTEMQEKLHTGSSLLYSFSGGLGYDFWGTIAYYMASPFNIILRFVPRANVADAMDYLILFKIALCGGTFSWYLQKRDPERHYSSVVFGVMFALGNFIIGYYFNIMWLDSIAMLPLIMRGIEDIVRKRDGRLYGISLFFALWCNYYIGFMLCIFSCLYLVCVLVTESRRLTMKRGGAACGRFAVFSLLAGGMSALMLLPAYRALTSSEAMLGNHFPGTVKFYTGFIDMMAAHFAAQPPINIADTQVGLNAYCGVSVLFFVVLYALDNRRSLRERLSKLALAGFLLLSFSLNILNYIWHGFHTQNGLPNRFAFIYVAVVLVMSFDATRDIRRVSGLRFAAAAAVPLIFTAASFALGTGELQAASYGITLGFLMIYCSAALLMRILPSGNRAVFAAMAGIMLAEAVGSGIYGIICNDDVTRSIYLADQASYQKMIEPLEEEQEFFRSEIDSQRMRNVTMYAGGNALVMFNSTMNASVTELCDRLGIEGRTNKNGYNGVTKLMNDVFGIRYVLSSNGKGNTLYQFEFTETDENLDVYENRDALAIGFMTDPALADWNIEAGDPMQVQNEFAELATGLDGIYVLDRTIDLEDGGSYDLRIPEDKQVYIYLPERVDEIQVHTPEYDKKYTTYTDHLYTVNSMDGEDRADFSVKINSGASRRAIIYTCPNSASRAVRDALAKEQLENVRAEGNTLTGTVTSAGGGMLLITVPYSENWRTKVDGKDAEIIRVGGALTGIMLDAGTHEISMVYVPGGLTAGAVISAVCALLYVLCFILEKKKKKTEPEEERMEIAFSRKAGPSEAGIFAVLNEKKEELLKQGRKIFNLSVGTPDFPTPERITEAVSKAAQDPENYKYSLTDRPWLVQSVIDFYRRRFGVELEPEEIMSVYGSQEAMAHISWVLCDPGDLVLVPNPGYPIFKMGPLLCDARVWEYPLREENGFLPDLDEIPEDIAQDAKFMVVSYPGNPHCRTAPASFYEELIRFARRYNIVILHDNAYSDIIYGGRQGLSFLSFEGAKEVGIEFYSLSKSYDYTGARMSFVIGNREIVCRFRNLRSQFDYGIFLPVQAGAAAALSEEGEAEVKEQCRLYEERCTAFCGGLRSIGWNVPDSEGTMFVWAPLPEGYKNSEKFCIELMERTGVICVPGSSFGSLGEGYVRFALVLPPEQLLEAVRSIEESGMIRSANKSRAEDGSEEV